MPEHSPKSPVKVKKLQRLENATFMCLRDRCAHVCMHTHTYTFWFLALEVGDVSLSVSVEHPFQRTHTLCEPLPQKPWKPTEMCMCAQACPTLGNHMEPAMLLCPWNFPGKNTGVGCHFRRSSPPKYWTYISCFSCISIFFTTTPPGKPLKCRGVQFFLAYKTEQESLPTSYGFISALLFKILV